MMLLPAQPVPDIRAVKRAPRSTRACDPRAPPRWHGWLGLWLGLGLRMRRRCGDAVGNASGGRAPRGVMGLSEPSLRICEWQEAISRNKKKQNYLLTHETQDLGRYSTLM
jgi:hypothetical protein